VILTNDKEWVGSVGMARTGCNFPHGCEAVIGAVDENDSLVAGVVYDHFTETCVTATIAIEKKNLPRRLVKAMFRYPFEQMGVKKIIVYLNEANRASVRLASKLGFAIEGRIKDVYPDGSMFIMSLSRANCVWIGD